jgi:hypothetical protein
MTSALANVHRRRNIIVMNLGMRGDAYQFMAKLRTNGKNVYKTIAACGMKVSA